MSGLNGFTLLTHYGASVETGAGGGGLILNEPPPSGMPVIANAGQMGWRFTVAGAAFAITGLRLYMSAGSGSEIARLWRASDKALVASVAITPSANEWIEGLFGSPVLLGSGTSYVITTRQAAGASRSVYMPSASALTISPLVAFERGVWASGDAFPNDEASLTVRGLIDVLCG